MEKKEEIFEKENNDTDSNKNNKNTKFNGSKNEEKDEKIDKKQSLLKLLIQKKNSNEFC